MQIYVVQLKLESFDITRYTSKTVQDRHIVTVKSEQKVVYTLYRMMSLPMTLSDLNHSKSPRFYPRDATLARYLLSSCVRLSVRLSQVGVHTKMAKPITQRRIYDSPGTLVF